MVGCVRAQDERPLVDRKRLLFEANTVGRRFERLDAFVMWYAKVAAPSDEGIL